MQCYLRQQQACLASKVSLPGSYCQLVRQSRRLRLYHLCRQQVRSLLPSPRLCRGFPPFCDRLPSKARFARFCRRLMWQTRGLRLNHLRWQWARCCSPPVHDRLSLTMSFAHPCCHPARQALMQCYLRQQQACLASKVSLPGSYCQLVRQSRRLRLYHRLGQLIQHPLPRLRLCCSSPFHDRPTLQLTFSRFCCLLL